MKSKLYVLAVLGLLLPLQAKADTPPGPRDPLSFQDSGLYGGFPNSYFCTPTTPFTFFAVQAVPYPGRSNATWNNGLHLARQSGKRIIAVLHPQISDGQGGYYGISELTDSSTTAELNALAGVVDEFLSQVNESDLQAITLGEENIFWSGRESQLNYLYDRIKTNHSVPIYQWHSPSSTGTAPGISGWPNLKADGWVADEYFLDQPAMEKNMRAYVIEQKPVIQTIWAGGSAITSVPFIPQRFAEQISVLKKYNIPGSYFTWSGVGGYTGYDYGAPEETKAKFQMVLDAVEQAKLDGGPDFSSWDSVPWQTPVIALAQNASGKAATYRENYAQDRVVRFINDAAITGFANLRWDSSAVELRPRQAGTAQASVAYTFQSPGTLAYLKVIAPAFQNAGQDAAVSMSVFDANGTLVRTTQLTSDRMTLGISGAELSGRQFKVVYSMNGTAAAAGDVLAGVNSVQVDAVIGNRPLYAFQRQFNLGDVQEQNRWSVAIGPSTGPQGAQFNPTTTHYNPQSNAYEPLNSSEVRIRPADASTNGTGDVTVIRRVDAGSGEIFTNPVFEADAHGYGSWGSAVQLWLSADGIHWNIGSTLAQAWFDDQHLIADATGVDGFQDLSSVWLKIRMYDLYGFGNPTKTYVHAWNLTLVGLTTAPVPEPTVVWSLAALTLFSRRAVRSVRACGTRLRLAAS